MDKKKTTVSTLVIFEIMILLLGIGMSIASTFKALQYTLKYVWCFLFPVLGIILVVTLIIMIRKKRAALIGLAFICIYLLTAGFGAIVCEVNSSRLRILSQFDGKEVTVSFADSVYIWDGSSVTYDPRNMEPYSEISGGGEYLCMVGGEKKSYVLYSDREKQAVYYLEVSSAGTGIYFILSPKQ